MNNTLINLTERMLLDEKDFIVPAKKIWLKLSLMGKLDDVHFENFTTMLKEDDRFEVFDHHDNSLIEAQGDDIEHEVFFEGPQVMLKSRKPSRSELGNLMITKTNTIYKSLQKAWDLRDVENKDEEDQLLQALASTQRLLRALKKEFVEPS